MSKELRETERMLFKLEGNRKNGMIAIRGLEQTKERLLSFAEYAKEAQSEVLDTLIQDSIVFAPKYRRQVIYGNIKADVAKS